MNPAFFFEPDGYLLTASHVVKDAQQFKVRTSTGTFPARLVKAERQGKQVFYAAADQHISGVLADLLEHIAEPHPDAD